MSEKNNKLKQYIELMDEVTIANQRTYLINTLKIDTSKMTDKQVEQTIARLSDAARCANKTL